MDGNKDFLIGYLAGRLSCYTGRTPRQEIDLAEREYAKVHVLPHLDCDRGVDKEREHAEA